MKRKLIKQGRGGSFTINLPKKWVDERNLKSGEDIDLAVEEDKITIRAEEIKQQEYTLKLDITNFKAKTIDILLMEIYSTGFTKVLLTYKNKNTETGSYYDTKPVAVSEFLTKIVINNIGFEIFEQDDHSTLIKQVSKVDEEEFNMTIRRLFILTKEINNKLLEFFENRDTNLNTIQNDVLHMWRFVYYGMRLISLNVVQKNKTNLHAIMDHFEIISSTYNFLISKLTRKDKFDKDTIKQLIQLKELSEIAYSTFYKFNFENYAQFDKELRKFYKQSEKYPKNCSDKEIEIKRLFVHCALSLHHIMKNTIKIELGKRKVSNA
ncbi:MAG: hypothetical protein ABIG93_03450 [archaeon]|nr:hypothetical protein [Nanoarchaeota archaeon]